MLKHSVLAALLAANICTAATLAKRGEITATTEDFYAYHYMNSPAKVEALRSSAQEIQSTVLEVLAPRVYRAQQDLRATLNATEQKYVNIQLERAPLLADLNVLERRVRANFDPNDPLTLSRAKEIWFADSTKFNVEETADITQIFFDFNSRRYEESIARISAAQKALAAGGKFEDVLQEYSDDKNAKESGGKISGISSVRSDPLMGRVIFKRLAEGEVSAPTPARTGMFIVRLDKKYPTKKQPFEDVKAKIMEQMMEDAVKQTRVSMLDRLARADTVIDENEFEAFLIKPDPKMEEKRREIYKGLGIRISEPIDAKEKP